jgi:hypothetical protein
MQHESLARLVTTAPRQRSSPSTGSGRHGSPQTAPGLSFGLIHPRPPPFTGGHRDRVRAVGGRWRTPVNGGAQYSKACEGASLPWVQIPPPPPLTWDDTGVLAQASGCSRCVCLIFWPHCRPSRQSSRLRAAAVLPGHAGHEASLYGSAHARESCAWNHTEPPGATAPLSAGLSTELPGRRHTRWGRPNARGRHGQASLPPGGEPAVQVGGVPQAEPLQGRACKGATHPWIKSHLHHN